MSRRAWRNHRQRNPPPCLVDLHHPDFDNVAHRHHIVRIAHKPIRQLAHVHQAAIVQADIDKCAKVDNVQHAPHQFHALIQIFQLQNPALENRRRQIFAWIAPRPHELRQNIAERH
jgi:hypothetical protein